MVPRIQNTPGKGAEGFSWTIQDGGKDECWAIVGPSSETGGTVRHALLSLLLGEARARCAHTGTLHPPAHPFLADNEAPQRAIAHVAFGTRTSGGGAFVDYATRYGSIRDADRVTLRESLLESLNVYTGRVAQQRMRPDPLAPPDSASAAGLGLLKWSSEQARNEALQAAYNAQDRITRAAPLLHIDDALLERPVIALSNGQTRRARILHALISGAQLVVLDEPFTGLDPPTRDRVTRLLAALHEARTPRICLVLREQDVIPSFVTHLLRVDEQGGLALGPADTMHTSLPAEYAPGSYERVCVNFAAGVGVGDGAQPPVVAMHDVSITYGDAPVLRNVSLQLHPGARLVLVGDNGSGKTTLLSLLLGDNPRSYAFDASQLMLFGAARDAPRNAHVLLQRRIGHLSPELFNAFPRRSLESGGLTVEEAVASGFDGIFTRRSLSPERRARVHALLQLFADVLAPVGAHAQATPFADVPTLAQAAFSSLTHGSQAVCLLLRATVHRPSFLVLDEPFQGMSARQAARVRAFLDAGATDACDPYWLQGMLPEEQAVERVWRQQLALVAVSHYVSEWPLTCGRLVRLKQGQVVEQL